MAVGGGGGGERRGVCSGHSRPLARHPANSGGECGVFPGAGQERESGEEEEAPRGLEQLVSCSNSTYAD